MKFENGLPRVKKNIPLKDYTTFKIGGKAKYFFVAKDKKDLILAVKVAKKFHLSFFILGGGSNLLISDKGFQGLVIKNELSHFKIKGEKVIVESGVNLNKLIKSTVKIGLSELEEGSGIPGTVGGAIYGNTGAFGKSMADIVESVKVLNSETFKIKNFKNKDCKFGYRDSIFKHQKNLIIFSVTLQLKKGNKKEIQKKIKEYLKRKKETQPLNLPSAGSIFKNPHQERESKTLSAGELIEKCGLKGKKIGKAKISEKHANFIVNLGGVHPVRNTVSNGARAKDVEKLIRLIKKQVKNKFKINLEEEIQYLGL